MMHGPINIRLTCTVLKINNSCNRYNYIEIMAIMLLIYCCLKFTDILFFKTRKIACIQIYNIDVFGPEETLSVNMVEI